MKNYKFLNYIVLCNVFFAIVCIPTAGKLVDVAGVPLSISIYYFPLVYIFADILTEVYGYAVARGKQERSRSDAPLGLGAGGEQGGIWLSGTLVRWRSQPV